MPALKCFHNLPQTRASSNSVLLTTFLLVALPDYFSPLPSPRLHTQTCLPSVSVKHLSQDHSVSQGSCQVSNAHSLAQVGQPFKRKHFPF